MIATSYSYCSRCKKEYPSGVGCYCWMKAMPSGSAPIATGSNDMAEMVDKEVNVLSEKLRNYGTQLTGGDIVYSYPEYQELFDHAVRYEQVLKAMLIELGELDEFAILQETLLD